MPHIMHALWQSLGQAEPLFRVRWPDADPAALTQDLIEVVVQVNGKLRGRISVSPDGPNEAVEAAALADADVQRFLEGKPPRKVIVVRGKLVNIVA